MQGTGRIRLRIALVAVIFASMFVLQSLPVR
jgi:hypothetical protein